MAWDQSEIPAVAGGARAAAGMRAQRGACWDLAGRTNRSEVSAPSGTQCHIRISQGTRGAARGGLSPRDLRALTQGPGGGGGSQRTLGTFSKLEVVQRKLLNKNQVSLSE